MADCEMYKDAATDLGAGGGADGDAATAVKICTLEERPPGSPARYSDPVNPARECNGDLDRCPFSFFNYW